MYLDDIKQDADGINPYWWVDSEKENKLFYSEENIAVIRERIRQLDAGQGVAHELIEV